jgi:RNase P subunit RPR2
MSQGRATVSEQKTIRIMCPNLACQRILAVPVHARGKLVRCRSCGMTIRIPMKAAEEVDASEEAEVGEEEEAA